MGVRDLRLGSITDALAWLRAAVAAVTTTPSGSPERQARLAELATAVSRARVVVDAGRGRFAPELRLAIHAAEVLVSRLQGDPAAATPPGAPPAEPRPRRVHPRRRMLRG